MAFLGLIPLRVWLAIGLAVVVMFGIGWLDHRGYVRGKAEVKAEWDSARAADAAEVNRLNALTHKAEQENAARIAEIGATYEKQLADLRNRPAVRLRVPGACPAQAGAAGVQTPAQGGDGKTDGELPNEIVRDLLDLAADADRNTLQLSACQQVIESYLQE